MEHIMYLPPCWKLEFIGLTAYALHNLERTYPTWEELRRASLET
jgi:hypothetical protein